MSAEHPAASPRSFEPAPPPPPGGKQPKLPRSSAAQDRLDWMRSWAEDWLENLKDRPAERYYADLPLEVACDMIVELTETT